MTGTVQGVNYRSFTVSTAQKLKLTGFVKNSSNGSVTGEAQGEQSSLDSFVEELKKGPGPAKVSRVSTEKVGVKEGESGFEQ